MFIGASFVLAIIALLPTMALVVWLLWRSRRTRARSRGGGDGVSTSASAELSTISDAQDAGAALRLRVSFSLFQVGYLVAVVGVMPITLMSAKLPNWFCIDYPRGADYGMLGLLPPGLTLMSLAIMPTDGIAIMIGSIVVGGTFGYWGQFFLVSTGTMLGLYRDNIAFRTFLAPYIFCFAFSGVFSILAAAITLPSLVPHLGVFRRFSLPPRVKLRRLWLGLRLGFFGMGAFLVQKVWSGAIMGSGNTWLGDTYQIVTWSSFLLCSLLTPRMLRARVTRVLGRLGSKGSDERQQAASVAALVGGRDAQQALAMARSRFRVLPLDALAVSDLQTNADTGLYAKTQPAALGDCDAFVSHSWRDDGVAKHAALLEWSEVAVPREEERVPTVWLDKACIDQDNIDESLAALPIFLSGCRALVAVVGPSYPTRLWCVMELFVFLRMGGKRELLNFKPIAGAASFARFSAAKAQCMRRRDREKLLAVIESSFGELLPFSLLIRELFADSTSGANANKASAQAGTSGASMSSMWWKRLLRIPSAARVLPRGRARADAADFVAA